MTTKQEEFILDVRRAVRAERKPVVVTDSEVVGDEAVSKAIKRAALWLTPKVVQAYAPEEFGQWTAELQDELHQAVEDFKTAASATEQATHAQFLAGLDAFHRLAATVRKVVLDEWIPAAEEIVEKIEAWSKEFGWQTRRKRRGLRKVCWRIIHFRNC